METELPKRGNKGGKYWDRKTCQKPELASSFKKTVAPDSWARTWSTDGRWCRSRRTLSLSLVRSTQMHTFPPGLGTTTILTHQSVGCSTLAITPSRSSHSSSSFTGCIRDIATLLTMHWDGIWLKFDRVRMLSFLRPLNS